VTTTEEETVTIAGRDFTRRRWNRRLRRLRPFLYAALVLGLLATGVWLLLFSSVLTVREVSVTGDRTINPARVKAVAKAPMGQQLARADLDAVRARVETIPAVKSASVSRSWPHTVAIAITERIPVAVVDRGGGLQAVDDQGVLFGSYPRKPADLPLLETAPDVKAEALAEAARVVMSLRPDIQLLVDRVEVQSVDRIELRLDGGRTVMWGSAEQSGQKAEVLAVLLGRDVQQIDVSVPGRPTTR
jgi:cell division protein FtsQ